MKYKQTKTFLKHSKLSFIYPYYKEQKELVKKITCTHKYLHYYNIIQQKL